MGADINYVKTLKTAVLIIALVMSVPTGANYAIGAVTDFQNDKLGKQACPQGVKSISYEFGTHGRPVAFFCKDGALVLVRTSK